ncbi:hypothetical protein ACYSTU_12755 [Pseudomonas glycinis]
MIHIMLSLDLKNADEQRDDLYKKLRAVHFIKVDGVDTVWVLPMNVSNTQQRIDELAGSIHEILRSTVEKLDIQRISYVLQMGNTPPTRIVVEKVRGIYKVNEFDPAVNAA